MSEMTTKIMEESLGKIVLVRLRGGKKYAENMKKLGAIIVRGDNVVIISPPPR